MSVVSRRSVLGGAAACALATALPLWLGRRRDAASSPAVESGGLVADPAGLLHLARGYSYTVVDRMGDVMTDGFRVPGAPDGMGVFPGAAGTIVLLRNHELWPSDGPSAGWSKQAPPRHTFDPDSFGGVTRVVLRADTLAVVESNVVLAGTNTNCAGGASPWGWLTCEEDVSRGHGWVFACPADARTAIEPAPIRAYGRFRHEAATVDPRTMVAYLTEDRDDACFYRFVPASPATPFEGRLEALAVDGPSPDTSGLATGEARQVRWIPVEDPTPDDDTVRGAARARGAALIRRGEGIYLVDGPAGPEVFFTATTGGPLGAGQILRLRPEGEGGVLDVVYASTHRGVLDMPDNLAVRGDGVIFVAEDGRAPCGVRAILPSGDVVTIGEAAQPGELAGVCLAPAGDVLFVNLQRRGVTVAIRGPLTALG